VVWRTSFLFAGDVIRFSLYRLDGSQYPRGVCHYGDRVHNFCRTCNFAAQSGRRCALLHAPNRCIFVGLRRHYRCIGKRLGFRKWASLRTWVPVEKGRGEGYGSTAVDRITLDQSDRRRCRCSDALTLLATTRSALNPRPGTTP
jgi:hypothetical protein